MPAAFDSMEDLRRAQVEHEQLHKVCQMKEALKGLVTCTLDGAALQSLGVLIGQPLDIDEAVPWDFATTYFQPWAPSEIVEKCAEGLEFKWMDKLVTGFTPAEWEYGNCKADWFLLCLRELYNLDPNLWEPWHVDPREIYRGTGLELPMHELEFMNMGVYTERQYQPEGAYFPVCETKPHVACLVIDSNEAPGDQVLRSEVDYAIELIRFRLRKGCHTNHHTKPALIYTLERDQFARITQAYFDGKANTLVLRQSRHLDLRGPAPTDDAFLLLRWIANRPVGDTEYAGGGGVEGEAEGAVPRDPDSTAPKFLVGEA